MTVYIKKICSLGDKTICVSKKNLEKINEELNGCVILNKSGKKIDLFEIEEDLRNFENDEVLYAIPPVIGG